MKPSSVKLASLIGLCALSMGACTQQNNNNKTSNTETTEVVYQTTAEDLAKYVEAIYGDVNREFAGEINMDLDSAYCSESWKTRLAEMHKKQDANPDEPIDFFSANYWVMGQDALNVRASNIEVESLGSGKATVSLDLSNFGETTHVQLQMVYENGDWKIDNFIDMTNEIDWGKIMNQ